MGTKTSKSKEEDLVPEGKKDLVPSNDKNPESETSTNKAKFVLVDRRSSRSKGEKAFASLPYAGREREVARSLKTGNFYSVLSVDAQDSDKNDAAASLVKLGTTEGTLAGKGGIVSTTKLQLPCILRKHLVYQTSASVIMKTPLIVT